MNEAGMAAAIIATAHEMIFFRRIHPPCNVEQNEAKIL
jgi:hypothetical protein